MKRKNFFAILLAITTFLLLFPLNKAEVIAEENIQKVKLQNSVVFLTFNEEPSFEENFEDDIKAMYETSSVSVKNYLLYQSREKVELFTNILKPENADFVRSNMSVAYYKPRYKWTDEEYLEINPEGYDNRYFNDKGEPVASETIGAKVHIDEAYREQLLLNEIVNSLKIDSDYDSDLNGDGIVDSLVIITDFKDEAERGEILWPHMGNSRSFDDKKLMSYYYYESGNEEEYRVKAGKSLKLGDASVHAYNIISAQSITSERINNNLILNEEGNLYNVGVLAHEMMHTLGLSDYYSDKNSAYQSVGEFDLMGSSTVIPQNMLGYLRYKMGWLDYSDILYINDSGEYSLPLTYSDKEKTIAKIVLSDYHQTGDYFMLEFRSKSLATAQDPFDCGLSGDGLIVYRVNRSSAYYNKAGELGNTDYGNMYGKDEIYVYRVGDPNTTKALSSPTGISYALLGNNEPVYSIEYPRKKYSLTTFGNADKNKTADTLISSELNDSETALFYSDGKNSGIVISNVTIDLKEERVKFSITLPEKQSTIFKNFTPESVEIDKFLDGNDYLLWNSDVKSGTAHILAVRSTDRLRRLAETGKSGITIEDFKNGQFKHYDTIKSFSVPLAEKSIKLPKFEDETLLFIALESQSGSCVYRYVGCIESLDLNFSQYLYLKIDKIYYVYFFSFVILITLIVTFIYYRKKITQKNKRR